MEKGGNFLVIPDVHGELEHTKRAVGLAEQLDAAPVFLGDTINRGPNSKEVIELVKTLGDSAIAIVGNHEWYCRTALYDPDYAVSTAVRDNLWAGDMQNNMLKSYDLPQSGDNETDAFYLRQAMEDEGHWDFIDKLPSFFETDEFVAVHAGPKTDEPWESQRADIEKKSEQESRLFSEPQQVLDPAHKLSGVTDVPREVDERIFITGHRHLALPPEQRTAERRVCLASILNATSPLYAWESRTGKIHTVEATEAKSYQHLQVVPDTPVKQAISA